MGQASRNKHKVKAQSTVCILCAKSPPATVDHIPPRIFFRKKQWPEGFAFPVCQSCNNDSAIYDRIVAFLAMSGREEIAADDIEDIKKLISDVIHFHPDMHAGMLEISTNEKKRFAKRANMLPKAGQTFREIPLVHIPDSLHFAVKVFAAKLVKALHFKHTGLVVNPDVGLLFRWFTNANKLIGELYFLPEITNGLTFPQRIVRNNVDLRDQFDYGHFISEDKNIAVYRCFFGYSFGFEVFLINDKATFEDCIMEAKKKNVLEQIYWPLPT